MATEKRWRSLVGGPLDGKRAAVEDDDEGEPPRRIQVERDGRMTLQMGEAVVSQGPHTLYAIYDLYALVGRPAEDPIYRYVYRSTMWERMREGYTLLSDRDLGD